MVETPRSLNEIYNKLNSSWKSVCKIVLGREIGELKNYEDYLTRGQKYDKYFKKIKTVDNETSYIYQRYYSENARYKKQSKKPIDKQKLSIDEIKDLDSILE